MMLLKGTRNLEMNDTGHPVCQLEGSSTCSGDMGRAYQSLHPTADRGGGGKISYYISHFFFFVNKTGSMERRRIKGRAGIFFVCIFEV